MKSSDAKRTIVESSVSQKVTTTVFSLTKLNEAFSKHVKEKFSQTAYWITCEITKINEKSGHYYLELADSLEGKKTALASAVIWNGSFRRIQENLLKVGEDPRKILAPGNRVQLKVIIDFHSLYGLKLFITNLDPTYTLGDIEKQKKLTLNRLISEGLLKKQQRLYLSPINKRIALIGSPETSGYNDFYHELLHNNIYINFTMKTFATSVQGDAAVLDICTAIREADLYDVDVIVLVRGGGSKMDLNVFNHYKICKAIANCQHPVLTGIGHETDNSLVDQVACFSEKTPTAIAKFLYNSVGIFRAYLAEAFDKVKLHGTDILYQKKDQMLLASNTFFRITSSKLKHFNTHLDSLAENYKQETALTLRLAEGNMSKVTNRFAQCARENLLSAQEILRSTQQNIRNKALQNIEESTLQNTQLINAMVHTSSEQVKTLSKQIDQTGEIFILKYRYFVDQETRILEKFTQILRVMDPGVLLAKGYSISTVNDKLPDSGIEHLEDKEMKTITSKHIITSTITKIEKR